MSESSLKIASFPDRGVGSRGVSAPVSARLAALEHALHDIAMHIRQGDRRGLLQAVARHVCDVLNAESCGIFLIPSDSRDSVRLEGSWNEVNGAGFEAVTLAIHNTPGLGLTGHLAHAGEIVRLHGKALAEHPSSSRAPQLHLTSQDCQSLLALPLKNP